MKKSLIALMALASLAAAPAFAGNDVPGNCGKGSGSGNACLPGTASNNATNRTNVNNANLVNTRNSNRNTSNSSSSASSSSSSNSSSGSTSRTSVGNISPVQTNAGNNSSNSASNSGNNTVVEYHNPRTVSSAYAAPLAASNGSCMGSTSGGVQGASFGVSVGSTWSDVDCNRRYNAMMLSNLGKDPAAIALMCQDPAVEVAMRTAGMPCPQLPKQEVTAAPNEPTDPYVRRRLGLAPL